LIPNAGSILKTAGVLINIECKVWAKNIIRDRQRRLVSIQFELLMD
jgi:sodium/potassium-transporting ATPase subunit beta